MPPSPGFNRVFGKSPKIVAPARVKNRVFGPNLPVFQQKSILVELGGIPLNRKSFNLSRFEGYAPLS